MLFRSLATLAAAPSLARLRAVVPPSAAPLGSTHSPASLLPSPLAAAAQRPRAVVSPSAATSSVGRRRQPHEGELLEGHGRKIHGREVVPPAQEMSNGSAEWTDENTQIIVELFVKQVKAGNMPSTHLTPNAYDDVGKEFLLRT